MVPPCKNLHLEEWHNCQSSDPAKGPLRWDAERLTCPLPALLSITVAAAPPWLKPFLIFYISRELSNLQMQRAVAAPILTTAVYCGCRWRMNVLVLWEGSDSQAGWEAVHMEWQACRRGAGLGVGVGVEGGGRGWGERAGDLHTHPFPGFRSKQRRRLSTCTPPVHRPAGKKNDFEPMLIYPSGNFYYAFCYF